jgi:hypothetical protein
MVVLSNEDFAQRLETSAWADHEAIFTAVVNKTVPLPARFEGLFAAARASFGNRENHPIVSRVLVRGRCPVPNGRMGRAHVFKPSVTCVKCYSRACERQQNLGCQIGANLLGARSCRSVSPGVPAPSVVATEDSSQLPAPQYDHTSLPECGSPRQHSRSMKSGYIAEDNEYCPKSRALNKVSAVC